MLYRNVIRFSDDVKKINWNILLDKKAQEAYSAFHYNLSINVKNINKILQLNTVL